MPRPRKAKQIRRIELRLADDAPLLLELVQESRLRGVELTQHIHDLLRSRHFLRHGQSFQELLWVPGSATTEAPAHTAVPEPELAPDRSATAAALAWAGLLDTDGA